MSLSVFIKFLPRPIRNGTARLTATGFSRQASSSAPVAQAWEEIFWNDKHDPNETKFSKVLIANRGEIACRVIHSCRRLGIKTVAVHSDVDSLARHAQLADEKFCIGPAPSAQSYLNMDAILEVCRVTGAEAVHPGYGFLSENMDFARRLEEQGVVFVGPNSHAIKAMGDKIESKRIAVAAKVNGIPGFDGVVKDSDHCVRLANEIGYPVMIKASAGGGGKGMRIAWNDKEAISAFRFSTEEARSSFGDDRLLIEKYIDKPRHIEVQVLCDQHGNGIYLNERECSIQRRNQKVIEEAPSTFLNPETRQAMGEQAVALAKAVGYSSAGTVEFLVDANRNFYFLEMNTRLQVEHPITECTTGVDLVHQMLRSARGHPLQLRQSDIGIDGWSIECRVYAEDPYKSFGLPSVGRLNVYKEPSHIPKVRCDSGIMEGSEISIYYDPMICKLVSYGPSRQEALETMVKALDSYVIKGVTHNIALLRDVITEKRFVAGDVTTNYLPEVYPDGFTGKQLSAAEQRRLAAVAAVVNAKKSVRARSFLNHDSLRGLLDSMDGVTQSMRVTLSDDVGFDVNVSRDSAGQFMITFEDGEKLSVKDNFTLADVVVEASIADSVSTIQLLDVGSHSCTVQYLGTKFDIDIKPRRFADMMRHMIVRPTVSTLKLVVAPMPGMVKSIAVAVGDAVSVGQEVCVLEAMKMQNSMTAAMTGRVKAVNFKAGQTVAEEDVIIELE